MPKVGVQKQKVGFQGRWVLGLKTCSAKDAHGNKNKNGKPLGKDGQSAFSNVATEPQGDRSEMPAEKTESVDQDFSQSSHIPARLDAGAGLVPQTCTIPPGVECVRWNLKSTPLKLGRGVTVLNSEDFVKGHLKVLAEKLRGDEGWLYDQWPLATLLADLKDIGVELRIPEHQ